MSREDAELDRLLRLARQADLPDAARLARVRARILPPTAAPVPTPKTVATAGKGILGAKIVGGLAAVGLAVWSYADLTRPLPDSTVPIVAPAPPPAEPQPEPPAASAGAPAEAVQPEVPVEETPKPRAKKPRTKAAAAPAGTLAQEAALLQLAVVELRAGQVERARATLAEFARRYPDSPLNADRERLERRLTQPAP